METKLKALINYLGDIETDIDIINDLILLNFTDDSNSYYKVINDNYWVLEEREIRDQLYDKAEGYAYDLQDEFEQMLQSSIHVSNPTQACKALKVEDLIDYISDTLDYSIEFDCELVDESIYSIFRQN